MRFIVDECTGPAAARWLRDAGHEVFSVFDDARGLADELVIEKAFSEGWILVANDKGFGEKAYRERRPHRGIVLLRLSDERALTKIRVLRSLLDRYVDRLPESFVVATENRVRFGRL